MYASRSHPKAWTFRGTSYDHPYQLAQYVAIEHLAPLPDRYAGPDDRDRRFFWEFLIAFDDHTLACSAPCVCPDDGHTIEVPHDCLVKAFETIRRFSGQRRIGCRD